MNTVEELRKAIKRNDIKAVREIFRNNKELLNLPVCSDLKCSLLLKAVNSNKEVIELLYDYSDIIRFVDHVILEEYLHQAISKGNVKFAELLLINGTKLNSYTLTNYIFGRKNIDSRKKMLTLLLQYVVDKNNNIQSQMGKNLLHLLVEKGTWDAMEIAEILLNYTGIRVNDRDNEGNSPLHLAIVKHNEAMVLYLINKGADVNLKDKLGRSPLLLAVESENGFIVEMLLSKGADTNAADNNGITALHSACFTNFEFVINLLISEGVNVSVEDKNGQTPFSQVKEDDYDEYSYLSVDRIQKSLVKEFSKLSCDNGAISEKDIALMPERKLDGFFEYCRSELFEMANTKFYGHYSFYSLLKKSIDITKLADLSKNEEVSRNFKTNLKKFSVFKNDLEKIWKEAVEFQKIFEVQYLKLHSLIQDFLPETEVQRLAKNLTLKILPPRVPDLNFFYELPSILLIAFIFSLIISIHLFFLF